MAQDLKDIHIVMFAQPAYGHMRPTKSLAQSLAKMGYPVTFLTGTAFQKSIEAIPGVEFVPLAGKADVVMSELEKTFPERFSVPDGPMKFIWDIEHVFFGLIPLQHDALQAILQRPDLQHKKVVMVGDCTFAGIIPALLGAKGARRVPCIAIGITPLFFESKDTAPFGMGLPPQGEEQNLRLNEAMRQAMASPQAALERILAQYDITKPLHGKSPMDNLARLADAYMQLCVPEMEYPRSDLRPNLHFVGNLLGGNETQPPPEWYQDFVVDDTSGRPLLMVSSGTLPGIAANDLIVPTIEACRDLPVRLVVCAVLVHKPEGYVLPDNVRWAEWIPFDEILPHTDIAITNAGWNGINQAFANGVPMIVAGVTEDKTETSIRAEITGAAINLRTQTPSKEQLREAIQKILGDPSYEQKAQALKRSFAEYDAVGSFVKEIHKQVESFYGPKTNGVANGHLTNGGANGHV